MSGMMAENDDDQVIRRSLGAEGNISISEDDGNGYIKLYPVPHSVWSPRPAAFETYNPLGARSLQDSRPRGARGLHIQFTLRLTKEIVNTYQICNPGFEYSESYNPKRYLTDPYVGVSNNGSDNKNDDLILYVGRILANDDNTRRYAVKDLIGGGTFGQVYKCLILGTNLEVAIKVIKNTPAFSTQARVEIGILHRLNSIRGKRNEHHVVRSIDHFSCEGHLCIVFELLGINLYDLLKMNSFKGISLQLVRVFTGQMLDALSFLNDAHVIHCDIKPENILLSSLRLAEIKLVDFGSACLEAQTVYTYIQSRFYRSPEVVLGHAYSTAIDMWSLGCVAVELFLGLALFPGACDYDLLLLFIEKLGKQPPDRILLDAKHTNKFFKVTSAAPHAESSHTSGHASIYQFLTPEEYEAKHRKKPDIGKFSTPGSLEDMIMSVPMKSAGKEELEKEMFKRKVFTDFLRGLLELDPRKRWTPHQASQHPFITEGPFTGPFSPTEEAVTLAKCPIRFQHIVGFELGPRMGFQDPFLSSDGLFIGHFGPKKDAVPRAHTSLGLGMEHNVRSGHRFRPSVSPQASQHPSNRPLSSRWSSDVPFTDPLSSRKVAVPHVRTSLEPTTAQNVSPGHGSRGSLSPHGPSAENVNCHSPQWPLSVYICFSDFLLLLCIFLEPLSNIWTCLTDQVSVLVGSLIQWFRIYILERYGHQVPSRHKWRVNSRDLKTNRFLGQGCSGIIYEAIWSGRENLGLLARKDFPAVKSDVFQNEVSRLVELGDHPNIVKSLCWTIDKRSCSLVMEYMRYDLYSVVQKRKGEQRKVAPPADSISPKTSVNEISFPFELHMSIDVILKIATGMMYLHSRKIAHGDLKPTNILVSSETSPLLVKVADFGLIKTKRSTTLVSYRARCLQIVKWKAPELFEDYLGSLTMNLDNLWTGFHIDSDTGQMSNDSNIGVISNARMRKADIYSFALTCSHILGVQNWEPNLSWVELLKRISCGLRPQLPSGCPRTLASLISSCWAVDPKQRPTFIDICRQLRVVKVEHMRQTKGHQIHYPNPNVRRPSTEKFKKVMKRRSVNLSRSGRRCRTAILK